MNLRSRVKAFVAVFVASLMVLPAEVALAERIKDIATVNGVRSNQLIGYGLVVGLDGSGDQTTQTPFTVQSVKSMLAALGVVVGPGINPQLKNVAAVMVTAELPPFTRQGQKLRYDKRPLMVNGKQFTLGGQIRDNMFWTLTSGVGTWTAYEVLMFWAMANGWAPVLSVEGNILVFALILFSRPSPRSVLLGFVVILVGEAIRVWAAGHLRKSVELVTSGP